MSDTYIEHAKRELKALGYKLEDNEEGPNKWIAENIFALLKVFGEQGHSGTSAPYVADLFNKLAKLEPAAPLQGTDDEWVEVGDGLFQNNRCSHVFKENGQAYDIEGIIFRDPDGTCCTNRNSRVTVTFPYTPKRQYVNRSAARD
jgi:hypothetical protein